MGIWKPKSTPSPSEPPETHPNVPGQPVEERQRPTLEHPQLEDFFRDLLNKPMEKSRGDETTEHGNDIIVQECIKVINEEFPDLAEGLKHVAGATQDGSGRKEKRLKEEYIADNMTGRPKGSSRPDIVLEQNGVKARINSTSMRGERMTSRELRSLENLKRNVGDDLVFWIKKLRPGMDENEYREDARIMCRALAEKWTVNLKDKKLISSSASRK